MILIVDLNPKLERRLRGEFLKGRTSQVEESQTRAVSPGISMARLATSINEPTSLMTYIGGLVGQALVQELIDLPIRLIPESLKDNSQESFLLEERTRTTEILTKEPRITREDMSNFYTKYKDKLDQYELVILAPHDRDQLPDDMTYMMTHMASQAGLPLVVKADKKTDPLKLIKARPHAMVMDRAILSELSGRPLNYMRDVFKAKRALFKEDLAYLLLVGSKQGVTLFKGNEAYYGQTQDMDHQELNEDYLMVGLGLGLVRKYDPQTTLRLAMAAGSVGLLEDKIDFPKIKALMPKIEIKKIEEA
ncbi:MAG: hypothetical protein Q4E37_01585 [Tissierellia bacterium]|nr:hypothetical protein [Tissierellia bacterium]